MEALSLSDVATVFVVLLATLFKCVFVIIPYFVFSYLFLYTTLLCTDPSMF